jgi:hypothetical protein
MKAKLISMAVIAGALAVSATSAFVQAKKPNILVIMGDDIGWFNASCYNSGIMGYQTPNVDRIAREGARLPTSTSSRVWRKDSSVTV